MPTYNAPIPDVATSLALAMVEYSAAPIILLDGNLNVVGLSASFSHAFGIDGIGVAGRSIFALASGEWNVPQLRTLLEATVTGAANIQAYRMDLRAPGRTLRSVVVNARRLYYDDAENIRLLVTVTDITEALLSQKIKDDLLREKGVLLQEVQHRVANSLQIIASVILQNARNVQSEETRAHLHDAHQRVMSIAVLQQQLATTRAGDVGVRAYFDSLCKSIGASMIRDHNQISLRTSVDQSSVKADVSVSLGLIVTELVINALKHAFPDGRSGKIVVGYGSDGANWSLSVSDNGVGIPTDPEDVTAGLGSSIVNALANQLHAQVDVRSGKPGTVVSIESDHITPAPL